MYSGSEKPLHISTPKIKKPKQLGPYAQNKIDQGRGLYQS